MKIGLKNVVLKNGKTLELRSASPADARLLLDHLCISHSESYQNLNTSHKYWEKVGADEQSKLLEKFENSSNSFMLVALSEGKIVAGLGLFGQEKEFTRQNAGLGISIQKAFCGSGLGTVMMEYALEEARQAGIHRIDLTVRTYNEAAIKLYERLSFRRVGLLKEIALIDGKYVDEYYYELLL